ncbi:MAG TPA: phosphopantothenoylcysteine decarboxylase, partial [Burkholderiales bacterium]|nr:phosphopantothenoylcysteine decarboxylase [Burkholderiales bacterium]
MGRMLEPEAIGAEIEAFFQPKLLAGKRVLVTAGPTEEPIDPVRVITNASSGRMGYAVARAAQEAGAEVTLVSGPVALQAPARVARIDVRTARQMLDAVKAAVVACDVFIAVAAVADYRVPRPAEHKIKKGEAKRLTLELEENPDILAYVTGMAKPPFCVGFAAESRDLVRNAREKRARKKVPLLAANLAQEALGADDNALTLFDERGEHSLGRGPKIEQARRLIAHIAAMLATGTSVARPAPASRRKRQRSS